MAWMENQGKKVDDLQNDFFFETKSKRKIILAYKFVEEVQIFLHSDHINRCVDTLFPGTCCKQAISEKDFDERSAKIQKFESSAFRALLLMASNSNLLAKLEAVEEYDDLDDEHHVAVRSLMGWADTFFNGPKGFFTPCMELLRDYYDDPKEEIRLDIFAGITSDKVPQPPDTALPPWAPISQPKNPLL